MRMICIEEITCLPQLFVASVGVIVFTYNLVWSCQNIVKMYKYGIVLVIV